MRKHFLILMLMALLPLAGWAASTDLTTKPSLRGGMTYTGSEQTLLTGSIGFPANYNTAIGGVLWVAKSTEAAPTFEEIAAATSDLNFPKGTDAGKYYIYYYVKADGGDYDEPQDWQLLDGGIKYTRINQATPTVTAPEAASGLVYTGTSLQLIGTEGSVANEEQTIEYSLDEFGTYKTDITDDELKQTNANETGYIVYWKVEASANYKAANGTINVPVEKANTVIVAPVGKAELVYNANFRDLIEEAGEVTTGDGTMKYSIDNENWYASYTDNSLKKKDANTYTVYYKVDATTNYKAVNGTIEVTIAARDINDPDVEFTTVPAASLVYDGTEKSTSVAFTYGGGAGTFTPAYNGERTKVTAEGFNTVITGTGNFTGTKSWNTKITAKDLSATVTVDETLDDPQDYTGSKIEPSTEDMLKDGTTVLVENTDYTVTYGTTGEGAKDNINVAKGGAIVINFKGNYKGSKTVEFAITKAQLIVTAGNNEKFYGEADPTPTYELTGFKGTEGKSVVTGTATFTRTAGEDAGEYTWAYSDGLTAANYSFASDDPVNQGKLTIKTREVVVAVANDSKVYGYVLPTLDKNAFDYEVTGLGTLASIASMEFVVTDAEDNTYAAGDRLNVGTYTITAQNAVASPASAATFTYTAGTLEITAAPLVVTTKNQNVAYATTPWAITTDDLSDTYVTISDNEDNVYTYTSFNTAFGTTFADDAAFKANFISALAWDAAAATLAVPGDITATLTTTYGDNFDVDNTTTKGKVVFTGAGTTIEIVRLDDSEYTGLTTPVADALQEYNGVEQIVTIKANTTASENNEYFRVMKADRWYAMVLPFNTTVREIAAAFGGYAVVDIFDESSKLTDDVKFKLHVGTIEANKPFILKLDQDLDLKTNPATFPAHEIVYSADPTAATWDNSAKFVGKYDGKGGFDEADGHQYVFSLSKGTISNVKSTTYIPPMTAYIWMKNQMNGMSKAREIIIEEPDGSTTAISTVNADGTVNAEGWYDLNGIKQQDAPTQKGVYIQNGKKLVVK